MEIHFNSIIQDSDKYIYEYHTQKNKSRNSTFGFLAIAGIIGSFKIIDEKGWLYLIPFWILVFLLSKALDWIIKKWDASKSVKIRFISKYPHYVLEDILWMLNCTNQEIRLGEIISGATGEWSSEIDIEIGKLSIMRINKANFTRDVLMKALNQQQELEKEWSARTGLNYPDLEMPKR